MAHLLVVDDTIDTCQMRERLRRRCGHTVHCLTAGGPGVAALEAVRFDAVLLDVMMPDVDGLTVLARVRAHADPAVGRVPVVMYTAVGDPAEQARAVALGASEWVVKGTPFALLRQRLEAFLGKLPGPVPPADR